MTFSRDPPPSSANFPRSNPMGGGITIKPPKPRSGRDSPEVPDQVLMVMGRRVFYPSLQYKDLRFVPAAAGAIDSLAQPEGTHYVRCLVSILRNNGESHDVGNTDRLGRKVNVKTQQVRKLCSCRPKYGGLIV